MTAGEPRETALTRRAVLRRCLGVGVAAATLGGAELAQRLVAAAPAITAAPAAGAPPAGGCASLRDIEHVVIVMQENRSFDQYFGTLRGVRGFDDPAAPARPGGRPVFYQPDGGDPDGFVLPFRLDTQHTSGQCVADVDHSWPGQHASWDGGRLDGWRAAHPGATGAMTMSYYTRADLPYYYALADAFTVCDRYFCAVLGPTNPNRLMAISGTIDPAGEAGGPAVDNSGSNFRWTTYPEQLQARGVSWRVYHGADTPTNVLALFRQYRDPGTPLYRQAIPNTEPGGFARDVATGNLPQVSWVLAPEADWEHPNAPPANGERFFHETVLAPLLANPRVWAKTAVFLTYDENGGYFDHVPPPTAPAGTPGEYVTDLLLPRAARGVRGPIGLGFRVPLLVVSPFSRGGLVCGDVFDHTSLLLFLERRFGAEVPNLSAWRRATVGDLTAAFDFAAPPDPSPPSLPDPGALARQAAESCGALPAPSVPRPQAMPRQEPGTRPRVGAGCAR
ncbi:MAG TPA: alkaline phosphatase family protein [Thermomicrobiales bacterium]|nr:alkaline phosphatase family protein [Thermomicrobiales bacterium]